MSLRDIDDYGNVREVRRLEYEVEFNRVWLSIPSAQRAAIEHEINRRLDTLIASPSYNLLSLESTR